VTTAEIPPDSAAGAVVDARRHVSSRHGRAWASRGDGQFPSLPEAAR